MNAARQAHAGSVALLLDADNLSSPELVAQALHLLQQSHGPVSIRRAYGSAENLKGLGPVLRELAFRPCVNLPLAKNTTDMMLAVDAMDLCAQQQLAVVAIGTGDADFAPLVLRLRELGVRTLCFSQANKMSPDAQGFYDEVVLISPTRRRSAEPSDAVAAAPVPRKAPARKAAAKKTPAKTVAAPAPTAARAPAPQADEQPAIQSGQSRQSGQSSRPAKASRASAQADAQATLSAQVQALLREMPGLLEGKPVEFGEVAQRLRSAKLMSRSASAGKFLKKHVPGVELVPEDSPHKLRWPAAR
ncbi:NYN domain-containing protein [Pseudorhodoferax sp. Leaf267]|uniref:NYN domain-containing protein n=1 Tax=Pseudorhodoferax sp. Leaf267 TaxID=1736316 RepID=UPI0006FBC9A4|nr:NYN domain-containing protein [Pseudorhodoferax sp. Leaf267]KQP14099.1 hypothetical protein ASF43_14760 [Pseudorhodoferax sp. Leaf267]